MRIMDDLRPELGCYGVEHAVTPNIDRIAAEGVRFDRAYVNYPLCDPARAVMITGRRLDFTGMTERRKKLKLHLLPCGIL